VPKPLTMSTPKRLPKHSTRPFVKARLILDGDFTVVLCQVPKVQTLTTAVGASWTCRTIGASRICPTPPPTTVAATANSSGFAFTTKPSPDGYPPQVIGPFDANADPVPDRVKTFPGLGSLVTPGGRSQGYTVADIGWYRKHFRVSDLRHDEDHRDGEGDGQRVELRFDGVYQSADVWLNGVHLGFHPNGYTPFAYDLTPHLNRHGENVLAVQVDDRGKTSRWYSGSGIYRHTWLTLTGPVRIPLWGVHVTTPVVDERKSVARVEVQATNFGASTEASVRMTVLDSRGRPVATQTTDPQAVDTGANETYTAELAISDAALWSPEDPNLYQVRTEILVGSRVVDAVTTKFGIRSLVFNGTVGFLLNGKPYKVRGGNIHHDHGPLGTVAIDRAEERTIEILKAAGFNAIRAAHNPRSPYMLDVCDRLGMLVWDEFTDVWDIGKLPDDYHGILPRVVGARSDEYDVARPQSPECDHLVDRQRDQRRPQQLRPAASDTRPLVRHN